MDLNRRGFIGRTVGAIAALPILTRARPASALHRRLMVGKLKKLSIPCEVMMKDSLGQRALSMNPDVGLVGGQYISMSSLGTVEETIHSQEPTTQQHMVCREAGFGVIYYLDPRGLFEEYETDADI